MHVRRTLALTLAVPLLLTGCSEDPEPRPKMPDPTPTSATPSPTKSETAETESPEEFIRRWAAIEAEMENTGDTSEYRELSVGCKACSDLADLVEKWYAAGGFIKWGGWKILAVEARDGSDAEYVVRVRSSPTKYKESAKGAVKRFDGGPGAHMIVLRPRAESWVVTRKAEVPQ